MATLSFQTRPSLGIPSDSCGTVRHTKDSHHNTFWTVQIQGNVFWIEKHNTDIPAFHGPGATWTGILLHVH